MQPDEQLKEKEDEMDDNKNKPMGWPILYTLATLAGVAVLAILKACRSEEHTSELQSH